ncbi:MAG: TlpA disulfide reductase family protein [Granulosicoccaceae bacterium]
MQRLIVIVVALAAAGFGGWLALQQQASTGPAVVYATDLNGQNLDPGQGTGRPKLINFWASWCKPCVVELPLIEALAQEQRAQLDVLAIAIDTLPHVQEFLAKHPLELPIAVGSPYASDLMAEWGNDKSALPFSVLLDAEGNLLKKHTGPFDANTLAAFVSIPE